MRIEIRNNSILIDGYVNAVARDSKPIPSREGRFIEQVVPKTFQRALDKTKNVDLLLNHNEKRKLGSIAKGNLELFEDNIGLRAIATVTDEEVIKKAKNNELRGWSFGFYVDKDRWEDGTDGVKRRYLEEIELTEVSIIDNTKSPAYVATSIETRDDKEVLHESRSEEFKAVIEDISETEKREDIDYSMYEKEREFLKLKEKK